MIEPQDLLDTSIAQIQTLTAFLREQLVERGGEPESETAVSRACNEILADLTVLMLRIRRRREAEAGPFVFRLR